MQIKYATQTREFDLWPIKYFAQVKYTRLVQVRTKTNLYICKAYIIHIVECDK